MVHALSLSACTLFVLFLLRTEAKGSPSVSFASWIPTIWLLSIASKPLGIWFSTLGTNEDGSGLDQLLLIGLAVSGTAVLLRRQFNFQRALRNNAWLVILLLFMFVS